MLERRQITTDFCVIGGGIAGICAAIAAAREGAKVVLMHDRPMFGGNASSEIRMWVCGAQGDNVTETGILEEIFMENLHRNPYKKYAIFDSILWDFVRREPNITALLNCSCMDAKVENVRKEKQKSALKPDDAAEEGKARILSVTGWQMTTQCFIEVRAKCFADCSGDSILAPLTGAHYRIGRESADEFGEAISETVPDKKTMGNSCLIQGRKTDHKITFIAPPFAMKLTDEDVKYRFPHMDSSSENFWYMELGGDRDTIGDAETVRDELISLAYGMWDYVKNSGKIPDADYWDLEFVGYLPGKRESRRMMGKYLMTQCDISSNRSFDDVVAFGGWGLDDHDPAGFHYDGHPNRSPKAPAPYAIPYRTLYSENIQNLFFAGRNISMTHAAMSSTRVMGTCGVCGQAVGTAAALTVKYDCTPHDILLQHLNELQETLLWNDCLLPGHPRKPNQLTSDAELSLADYNGRTVESASSSMETVRDGNDREHPFVGKTGDTLIYTFQNAIALHEVRIIFDSDLNRTTLPGDSVERKHMTRCNLFLDSPMMHMPTTLCEAFELRAELEDGAEVLLFKTEENRRRMVRIHAESVQETAESICCRKVKKLMLQLHRACCGGEEMRLFSFEVR